MTKRVLLLTLILAGCRDAQPPLPTTEQSAQLNEAEAMLERPYRSPWDKELKALLA